MVEFLIVTHGSLGQALVETANLIFGNIKNTTALGLYHGDDIEHLQDKIKKEIYAKNHGDGVLVLTDMFGGSPCNMTALVIKEISHEIDVECLVGVNLPLLIEALSMQEKMSLKELTKHCKEIGMNGIVNLREELKF